MPSEMTACPHCGAANSAKRRLCFECQREMQAAPEAGVRQRRLQPRAESPARPVSPPVRQRPLTPAATATARPTAPPTAALPRPGRARRFAGIFFGISLRQRAQFYRQMQSLLRAGIPLSLALHHIQRNVSPLLRARVRVMEEAAQGGGLLSTAMAQYPNTFPEWEVSVVRASESTGNLVDAMASIADTIELEMDLRLRINASTMHLKATLMAFLLVALIVTGLRTTQAAGFAATFASLGASMWNFGILVGVLVVLWNVWRAIGRSRVGASLIQAIVTRTPLIGPVMRNLMRLRFTRVLAALWNAGIAPMQALETAAVASGNAHMVSRAQAQLQGIGQGGSVAEAIAALGIYPEEALYLIQTGESSGTMGESLERVAEYMNMELESQVKTLPAKLQLWFYLVLAIAVGYFAIQFYTNYFGSMFDMINEEMGQ